MEKYFYTPKEAAERLRCSVRSVMRYKKAGLLHFVQHLPRGPIWFPADSLDKLDSEQKAKPALSQTPARKSKKQHHNKPVCSIHEKEKAELAIKLGLAKR